ncbi:hypothetical protein L682_03995 [Aquipseudomonas alcaligenes OT 69]|jgi:hypothetical protein|nr:hypothetical protein L682_03995 [Pseudomonas alcaligenes OT 69]
MALESCSAADSGALQKQQMRTMDADENQGADMAKCAPGKSDQQIDVVRSPMEVVETQ